MTRIQAGYFVAASTVVNRVLSKSIRLAPHDMEFTEISYSETCRCTAWIYDHARPHRSAERSKDLDRGGCRALRHPGNTTARSPKLEERDRLGLSTWGQIRPAAVIGAPSARLRWANRARRAEPLQCPADDLTRGAHPAQVFLRAAVRSPTTPPGVSQRVHDRVSHLHPHGLDRPSTRAGMKATPPDAVGGSSGLGLGSKPPTEWLERGRAGSARPGHAAAGCRLGHCCSGRTSRRSGHRTGGACAAVRPREPGQRRPGPDRPLRSRRPPLMSLSTPRGSP